PNSSLHRTPFRRTAYLGAFGESSHHAPPLRSARTRKAPRLVRSLRIEYRPHLSPDRCYSQPLAFSWSTPEGIGATAARLHAAVVVVIDQRAIKHEFAVVRNGSCRCGVTINS